MTARSLGLACACAVLLAGCGRQEGGAPLDPAPPGAATSTAGTALDGAARAAGFREAAAGWPSVEWRSVDGEVESRFTAFFDAGELRYVEERRGTADAEHRWWYEQDELFYYSGVQPAAAPDVTGAVGEVPVVVEFRGPEVVRGVRREHHGEVRLPPETLAAIRRRGAALAGAAQDEWSATQAGR